MLYVKKAIYLRWSQKMTQTRSNNIKFDSRYNSIESLVACIVYYILNISEQRSVVSNSCHLNKIKPSYKFRRMFLNLQLPPATTSPRRSSPPLAPSSRSTTRSGRGRGGRRLRRRGTRPRRGRSRGRSRRGGRRPPG